MTYITLSESDPNHYIIYVPTPIMENSHKLHYIDVYSNYGIPVMSVIEIRNIDNKTQCDCNTKYMVYNISDLGFEMVRLLLDPLPQHYSIIVTPSDYETIIQKHKHTAPIKSLPIEIGDYLTIQTQEAITECIVLDVALQGDFVNLQIQPLSIYS